MAQATTLFLDCENHDAWISNGYELQSNRYYKMYETLSNFTAAQSQCETDGGTLAMIENYQDKIALQHFQSGKNNIT